MPLNHMKLYFMMDADSYHENNPTIMQMLQILKRRGFYVDLGVAEELVVQADRMNILHDLYVVKSNTELSLSLAGILHCQGARMVNPYHSSVTVKDKIVTSNLLRVGGIPVPSSWVTGKMTLIRKLLEQTPLVIKPYRGHRGQGVYLVHNPGELSSMPQPRTPVLIQEFVDGEGYDLKVYVIGDNVWGVRTQSPCLSVTPLEPRPSGGGIPCAISDEVRDIALRCGQVLNLGLYGLDILETQDGPKVVDLNSFPSYREASGAASLLADYIADYAKGTPS